MKKAELYKLERAYWRLFKTLEKLAKTNMALIPQRDAANRSWNEYWNNYQAADLALAQREPVLFTVFVPERAGTVRECVRTAKHKITRWWRARWIWEDAVGHSVPSCQMFAGNAAATSSGAWSQPMTEFRRCMEERAS